MMMPMPADLRITSLDTDPHRPEAAEPITFRVECANVGNEGTGPFVVRFQLDNADSVELPVQTVAAGETELVKWPHAGLRQGDHHIECVLDAAHAVPEPEERRNRQTVQFKVHEIEFAPQHARGTADYDDDALADAVVGAIVDRANLWLTFALEAVDAWKDEATARVEREYADTPATVDTASTILAFAQTVISRVPGVSTGMGFIQDAATLGGLLRAHMGSDHLSLAGARAKLLKAIDELKTAMKQGLQAAIEGYDGRLAVRLSADNTNSPLAEVEWGSTDPAYVRTLADWLGIPQPTAANTTAPIKEQLMKDLESLMADVDRQLDF